MSPTTRNATNGFSIDDDDGDNPEVREEEEEEEDEQEEAMVLDGGQGAAEQNVAARADDHRDDHDGDASGTSNNHNCGHDNRHDNDDNDDNAAVDVGVPPPVLHAVEYYVEQPAYLERLPELMDAVERQLESASSWQALFGQTIGMRLKDLPSHKQGTVVDAINNIFNDVEAETAAEAAREQPSSTGSHPLLGAILFN